MSACRWLLEIARLCTGVNMTMHEDGVKQRSPAAPLLPCGFNPNRKPSTAVTAKHELLQLTALACLSLLFAGGQALLCC